MASSKNTLNRATVAAGLVLLLVGGAIGVVVGDIPYVTFKREVDLGTLVAILGLIATAFYIPYFVERRFSRMDNINEVVRDDIDAIIQDTERLKQIYVNIKPNIAVKEATYKEILALFKSISAAILALEKELTERGKLANFKEGVYNKVFIPTKDKCTEKLLVNVRLDVNVALDASAQLNKLCAVLRKYRYKTYSDK